MPYRKLMLEAGSLETRGLEVAGLGSWKGEAGSSRLWGLEVCRGLGAWSGGCLGGCRAEAGTSRVPAL